MVPQVIAWATRRGLVDDASKSHRKLHAADVPRLGGVAIVVGFFVPLIALFFYRTDIGDKLFVEQPSLALTFLLGGGLIALLGLYDDLRGASPKLKLALQLVAAIVPVALGVQIESINLPMLPMIELSWTAIPITILWIVGITNALNLIDGLDGLAGGVALFGLAPVIIIAVSGGNHLPALVASCLAGAVLGFLVFNFHPARIFMGDTGSMFLGYILATLSVVATQKSYTAVSMLTPVLALGLPLLDTSMAIGRRAWFGQSLFTGDKEHIHHRLLRSGLDHRGTVLFLYGFAAVLSTVSIAIQFMREGDRAVLLLASALLCMLLLGRAGYIQEVGATGTAGLRERNKLVRSFAKDLAAHIAAAQEVEALATAVAQLAHAAGAVEVRMALVGDDIPVRTWSWDAGEVGPGEHVDFPLSGERGGDLGTVTLVWPADDAVRDKTIPDLERGLQALAEAVDDAPPERASA